LEVEGEDEVSVVVGAGTTTTEDGEGDEAFVTVGSGTTILANQQVFF
jgi:hypothetical protein